MSSAGSNLVSTAEPLSVGSGAAWRICRARYLHSAFTGVGAESSGGRWNSRGVRMVYASANLSLAALELFIHVEPRMVPNDLISLRASIPATASVRRVHEEELPANWHVYPAPTALQELGSAWVNSAESLALLVPSAANPEESNVLLNPQHHEMADVHIHPPKPFRFDPRMFK